MEMEMLNPVSFRISEKSAKEMPQERKSDDMMLWEQIEKDSYLSQFLNSDSVKKSEDGKCVITCSLTASEQLSRLVKGINLLEKELVNHISQNHQILICQGMWIDKLEKTLEAMSAYVKTLLESIERTRNKLVDPYNNIEIHCKMLLRLHDTSNILRCIIQIQQLAKCLPESDVLKASSLISSVDEVCHGIDTDSIHILEHDKQKIQNERIAIQNQTSASLIESLENENTTQVAVCIQIFSNLKILNTELENIKQDGLSTIEKNTKLALDIQSLTNQSSDLEKPQKLRSSGPGRVTGSTFPGVNVAAFRSKLWSNWNNLLESVVYSKCSQMYILQHVISKQKPSNLTSDQLKSYSFDVIQEFWKRVCSILSDQLKDAAEKSTFIKQALEAEYPRLLRIYLDLNKKLQDLTCRFPLQPNQNSNMFENDNRFIEGFAGAYLSRSVARLLDGVHTIFTMEDAVPTAKDVDMFVRLVSNELSVSLVDESLIKTVCRNIGKAISLFCLKSEQSLVTNGNASQIIDVPNEDQQKNVEVANIVFYMKQQILRVLSNMTKIPDNCSVEITKSLANVDQLVLLVLDMLKNSICEAIESIILTIHQENFQSKTFVDPLPDHHQPSLYLRELQAFIARTVPAYVTPFQHDIEVQKCCRYIASRCIQLFVRHISLVRPISPGGRQILIGDIKHMEIALAPLCSRIEELGDKYKMLRSFRLMLSSYQEPEFVNSDFVGKIIPYSIVLMYLFSYASDDIQSPHVSCGWSVARLSNWLDNYESERERLEMINGALQKYEQTVKQLNKKEFDKMYPIMVNLLQSGFKSLQQ